MVFISVPIAPLLVTAATVVERRLGPSAAGWVAALPLSFAVALVAVALDADAQTAAAMALSAATHVPAQIAFAVVFAAVLPRRGLLIGAAAGTLAYVAGSIAVSDAGHALTIAAAIPALALAPRLMTRTRPRAGSIRGWRVTALMGAVSMLIVASALSISNFAGPVTAGAVAAFPSVSATLVVVVAASDGARAGAHALLGLVRSLPCYLTFCLLIALALPLIGLPAIALAALACFAAGRATWHCVPLANRASA
jgi:hypothetical protein